MPTVPTRLSAGLAGRYRIERELGAGGMATVYLAHDVRHDRDVAIKVLHPDLGAALGGERFLAEIRTTARLQHPHILPLLDSGESDGLLYYVMPYVAGETLRRRLERERQLPHEEAVRVAREVADALQYAHAAGIIHRDIKPENILLQGGHALVADFGIALAVQHAGGQRMTQTGLSLGTPQYMSPEQAMGEKAVDARTDIYALGAVTYEMLAGDPPFTGSSVQAIVAKVLAERPTPLRTLRDTIPESVEDTVLTALAKLPADRQASAADFARALTDRTKVTTGPRAATPLVRSRWRDPVVLGLAAGVIALTGVAGFLAAQRGDTADAFPMRAVITEETQGPIGPGVISPDGHSVAYSAAARQGGGRALYVRNLDQLTSRQVPGTNGISGAPAYSPDGKWLAFVANRRRLVKVPVDGGAPVTLANVADYGGIDWSPRGEIIVGAGVDEGLQGLFRVDEGGGALVPLTHINTARKELSHQSPRVLADGKTVLFLIWYGNLEQAELAATSLDDSTVTPLGMLGATPLGVVDGQLVYLNAEGVVTAVPFDVSARRVTGKPTQVQTNNGALVYLRGNENRHLVWVDRSGHATPARDSASEYMHVRLSPNGRQAALTIVTGVKSDIWNFDIAAGTLTPVTTTGASRNPVWSPDGQRLLYVSTHGGRAAFWWQPADGGGEPERALDPPHNPWNADLTPDGRSVVFNAISNGTFNVEAVSLDSSHTTRMLAASPAAHEAFGRVSPDGRWVAYMSDESGRYEVYVRSFAGGGGRVQVSTAGGRHAVWSHDGRQLYYWEGDRLIAVMMTFDPAPAVGTRTALFSGRYQDDFDVVADGSRFLMIQSQPTGVDLIAVPNWRTELRRLTASGAR
jgi:serine/threonine-protein kinase